MAEQARGNVEVNREECKGCGLCIESCPPKALTLSADLNHYGVHFVQYAGKGCSGCGMCYYVCPEPGGVTVYRLAVQKSEVPNAATL